jgi:hypothetical protein
VVEDPGGLLPFVVVVVVAGVFVVVARTVVPFVRFAIGDDDDVA